MHNLGIILSRYKELNITRSYLALIDVSVTKLDVLKKETIRFFDNGVYTTSNLGFQIGSSALVGEALQIEEQARRIDGLAHLTYVEDATRNALKNLIACRQEYERLPADIAPQRIKYAGQLIPWSIAQVTARLPNWRSCGHSIWPS